MQNFAISLIYFVEKMAGKCKTKNLGGFKQNKRNLLEKSVVLTGRPYFLTNVCIMSFLLSVRRMLKLATNFECLFTFFFLTSQKNNKKRCASFR